MNKQSGFLTAMSKHALVQRGCENRYISKELSPPFGGPKKRMKWPLDGKQNPPSAHSLASPRTKFEQAVGLVYPNLVDSF